MKKFLLLLAVLLLLSLVWCLFSWFGPHGGTVEVLQDGKVVMRLMPRDLKDERRLKLYDGKGGVNELLIKNGQICVESANCPGKDCVKMGWLTSRLPIICLPHKLTVRFSDDSDSPLDSISQ